jgi:hypothetical protein
MSEIVQCPTCGGPARAGRRETSADAPVLTAVTDEEKAEKIAQLREVVRIQKERLEAADQRIRDLEETLRQVSNRPGIHPSAPSTRPAVRPGPFQGTAGAF